MTPGESHLLVVSDNFDRWEGTRCNGIPSTSWLHPTSAIAYFRSNPPLEFLERPFADGPADVADESILPC